MGSLPRRVRCRQNFADVHIWHLFSEVMAEDRVAVAQQVARELVKRKRFPQLLCRPLRSWVGGHSEVQDATPVMGQYQKHVEDLETDRGHGEEVDGDQLLGVILQECAPGLRRRLLSPMSMPSLSSSPWMRSAQPSGILPAHLADQISDLARKDRSSGLAAPHLPGPEQPKASTMPGKDCFWLDDGQRRAPVAPEAGQADPQQEVRRGQFRAFCSGPLKHADLVAQSQVLELNDSTRTEDRGQNCDEGREKNEHRREL